MGKKQHLPIVFLLCAFFAGTAFSMELRPFVQWLAPGDVTVSSAKKGVKSETDFSTDFLIEGGAELLFAAEYNPMRYGFGIAYRSALKDGNHEAAPATIPIWGTFTFGRIDLEAIASPYMSFRVGTFAPLTTDGNWWERPLNWLAGIGVGAVFPFSIGFELYGEYSSLQKSFVDDNQKFRVNSLRYGAQLSIGIELVRDKIYKARSLRKR